MQVKISAAIPMLTAFVVAGLVPMIEGSPGMGKSAIVHQIAKTYNLKLIDLRLSQSDPTDLLGFPNIKHNNDPFLTRAGYVPMETFPLEGDSIPAGYSGWLLFLDEFNSAPQAVQSAAYKIVLDRMVGQHKLHKNVAIICAGNKETDNAIVQPMSTAMQSRLVHMELIVDPQEFCDYAASKGWDHRITSYIGFRPDAVYTFSPDHTDKTYACPRTWEFTNKVLKGTEITSPMCLPMLAGTLGEGVAREFLGFCRISDSLPKLSQILASPETTNMPTDLSTLWALSGSLAHQMDDGNASQMLKFIKRMPIEIQVFSVRDAARRNPALNKSTAVTQWVIANAVEIF